MFFSGRFAARRIVKDRGGRPRRAIARVMERSGPVIAVGEPGVLPTSGAARAYCAGYDWQAAVLASIQQESVVVMIAGITEGVRWELDQLIKHNYLGNFIVVFPAERQSFDARLTRLTPHFIEHPWGDELAAASRDDAVMLRLIRACIRLLVLSRRRQSSWSC